MGKVALFLNTATVLLVVAGAPTAIYLAYKHYTPGSSGSTRYEIALSADGSRAAVEKLAPGAAVEVFEGAVGAPWTPVRAPAGFRLAVLGLAYAPDGKSVWYSAVPDAEGGGPYTLWRQPVAGGAPAPLMQHSGALANVLPLRNGGVAFMGEVRVVERTGWSPNPRASDRWHEFRWMLWQPATGTRTLTTKSVLLTGPATMVRDELVLTVAEAKPPQRQGRLERQYEVQALGMGPGARAKPDAAALPEGELLPEPRVDCDWAGTTCVRLMTYDKRYYAHRAEVVRGGTVCPVAGLPDRIERHRISADGTAVLLLARENPGTDKLQLIHLALEQAGCGVRKRSDLALP